MKQKNILLVGSFSKGAIEHQFIRILSGASWNVFTYDLRATFNKARGDSFLRKTQHRLLPRQFLAPLNKRLFKWLESKNTKYDIILVFKGMELLPEWVLELRSHCSLLVNYNPDHPIKIYSRGAGNDFVRNAISHYHIYSSYAKRICNDLVTNYNVNSYYLPFGFDETIKIKNNARLNYLDQYFVFIGAHDKKRENALTQLNSKHLKIFGGNEWVLKSKSPQVKKGYTGESLYNEDYYFAQGRALGSINFLREQNLIEESHNMRTFEVPYAGGMLIADRTEEQATFFKEDEEAIYFSSMEELKSKLDYYHKYPEKARTIGKRARQRSIDSNYSYRRRIEEFAKFLQDQL